MSNNHFFHCVRKLRYLYDNKLTDADVVFLQDNLNKQEQILFYSMATLDQRHSMAVAYALQEMIGKKSKLHLDKMLKTALLHDVGKARAKLRIIDRVFQVLFFLLCPSLANYLADRGALYQTGYWRRILYVCKYHPQIGANLLKDIGVSGGVVYLVEHHHDAFQAEEAKELTVLREVDQLN